jgi:uncharacterized repeat protein (TIGR04076 family)
LSPAARIMSPNDPDTVRASRKHERTGRTIGDTFRLKDGYKLVSEIPLCMHSLAALLPYYNALRFSEPERWGLAGKDDKKKAYIQCLDAYSYTDGGTAIFEIELA